jgi:hypothetical protein
MVAKLTSDQKRFVRSRQDSLPAAERLPFLIAVMSRLSDGPDGVSNAALAAAIGLAFDTLPSSHIDIRKSFNQVFGNK